MIRSAISNNSTPPPPPPPPLTTTTGTSSLWRRLSVWRNKRRASPLWTVAVVGVLALMVMPIAAIIALSLTSGPSAAWSSLVRPVTWGGSHIFLVAVLATAGLAFGAAFLAGMRLPRWLSGTLALVCLLALATVLLPGPVSRTLGLMAGVAALTLLIGTSTAWLVTMYRFPGRRVADWLLVIPLAMPTYIIAFCYVEILDYSGTLQTALRAIFAWQSARDYWFPHIRSLGGAIFVMSFVLYPYVYLSARASFAQQSVRTLEVARTLGRTGIGSFWSVALPLARPALAAGMFLALMECLNDIGAVDYLGVATLTKTVYTIWLERSDLAGAAQIASVMLIFVAVLVAGERVARRGQKFHQTGGRYEGITARRLSGVQRWAATFVCFAPFVIGFVLPASVLVQNAVLYYDEDANAEFLSAAWHSIELAALAALVAVILALILAYARRVAPNGLTRPSVGFAGLGYAIPGTVLALGVLIPLAALDNSFDDWMRRTFDVPVGLLLSGSIFALVFAYSIRFMAISLGAVEAGLERISPNLDAAARALGETALSNLRRVHLPLLRPALGTAALLVFVDAMKELPATLLLRPFNFETLATHVYKFASNDSFDEAALAALAIVALGLVPVILLHRTVAGRSGDNAHRRRGQ